MTTLVIDASVAVKWIVAEQNSTAALALRSTHRFFAPDLLVAECANILWKKVQRGEVLPNEADLAARLVQRFPFKFVLMRDLVPTAFQLAVETAHPAYDVFTSRWRLTRIFPSSRRTGDFSIKSARA